MSAVFRLKNVKTLGCAGLILFASSVYAEGHSHERGEHDAAPVVQAGKKWETDAVLKAGMDQIRQAMLAARADIEANRLKSADYQRLGQTLEKHLADIVQNCKLSPKADSAFHKVVLADLTRDASLMRTSPKVEIQRLSAQGVLQTLRHYGDNFQHPGWQLDTPATASKP